MLITHARHLIRTNWLELLLILSLLALVGQLAGPSFTRWWHRPTPGMIGIDQVEVIAGIARDYLVYLPGDYSDKPCPLVVFLHGSGERGTDPAILRTWGPFAALENGVPLPAIVVAPQCLPDSSWEPGTVVKFVEQMASRYNVDRSRICLVGYSMGGFGVWQTATAHPDLFAAIVPIAGGGHADDASALVDIPVWAFHGAKDDGVPLVESERMTEAIRAAGGQPTLTILPDAGHGICNTVCLRSDLWDWLLEQRKGGSAARPRQ